MSEDDKPWIEKRFDKWEINLMGSGARIKCGSNEIIEIDKLYGPLAALGVRIRLQYEGDISDWVIEREVPQEDADGNCLDSVWREVARWDCQLDWWKDRP